MAAAWAQVVLSGQAGPLAILSSGSPDDVAEDNLKHLRRCAELGEAAAFYAAEALADGVHLPDIGAAGQEAPR